MTLGRSRYKITAAKISATKLRKKLFCMEGRSPESRTNKFIKAKKKDDAVMHKIPFCFCVIIKLLSEKIARGLLYDGFGGKKRENAGFFKKRTARKQIPLKKTLIFLFLDFLRGIAMAVFIRKHNK